MAREPVDRLADQLSGLLNDIDAAIRARFRERRSPDTAQRRTGLDRVVVAALRWFGSAGRPDRPTLTRTRAQRQRAGPRGGLNSDRDGG